MTHLLKFPDNFLWGTATASYQIEGGFQADGKGESIWDVFAHTPGKILNGDTGDVACDHYHLWREDVQLMKSLGYKSYRFSVSWPRIFPNGVGELNQAGLDFYNNLVDALLKANIQPLLTLFHWDLPKGLKGGWLERSVVDAFGNYAGTVARALGDRVKTWFTINEPFCASYLGYVSGEQAPGMRDHAKGLVAAHHLLLAHGTAVKEIRAASNDARVGIVLNLSPIQNDPDAPLSEKVLRHSDGVSNRWFLDPIFGRGYPQDMLADFVQMGVLPSTQPDFIKPGDMDLIAQETDLLGINYYTRFVASAPKKDLSSTPVTTPETAGLKPLVSTTSTPFESTPHPTSAAITPSALESTASAPSETTPRPTPTNTTPSALESTASAPSKTADPSTPENSPFSNADNTLFSTSESLDAPSPDNAALVTPKNAGLTPSATSPHTSPSTKSASETTPLPASDSTASAPEKTPQPTSAAMTPSTSETTPLPASDSTATAPEKTPQPTSAAMTPSSSETTGYPTPRATADTTGLSIDETNAISATGNTADSPFETTPHTSPDAKTPSAPETNADSTSSTNPLPASDSTASAPEKIPQPTSAAMTPSASETAPHTSSDATGFPNPTTAASPSPENKIADPFAIEHKRFPPEQCTEMGWELYPQGLFEILERVHREYHPKQIMITENGASYSDGPDQNGQIHDQRRIDYLQTHIQSVWKAIQAGIPVTGYLVWSLMDNFEWARGYAQRFGLIYIDFKNQKRLPKDSAFFFGQVTAHNSITVE